MPIQPRSHRSTHVTTAKILGISLLGLALAGCGSKEDLSDRPFIMACSGDNMIKNDDQYPNSTRMDPQLPETLAGQPMPDNGALLDAMPQHRIRDITRELGFTQDETPLASNVARLPLASFEGQMAYRNMDKISTLPPGNFADATLRPVIGEMVVDHYYLTRDGELKEVDDFHVATMSVRRGRAAYFIKNRTVAAALPSDAAYAVYHITAETQVSDDYRARNPTAMTGKPGFWILPLNESQRYHPADQDPRYGAPGERPLGPYVGLRSTLRYGDDGSHLVGNPLGSAMPHRRANEDLDTVQCFIKPGAAPTLAEFYDVEGGPDDDGYLTPLSGQGHFRSRTGNAYGIHFIGNREALFDLPSDPQRFEG